MGFDPNDPKLQATVATVAAIVPVYGPAIAGAYEVFAQGYELISNIGDVIDWIGGAIGSIGDAIGSVSHALGIGPANIPAEFEDAMHSMGYMGTSDDLFSIIVNDNLRAQMFGRIAAARAAQNIAPAQWRNAGLALDPSLQGPFFGALGMYPDGTFTEPMKELLGIYDVEPPPAANRLLTPAQQQALTAKLGTVRVLSQQQLAAVPRIVPGAIKMGARAPAPATATSSQQSAQQLAQVLVRARAAAAAQARAQLAAAPPSRDEMTTSGSAAPLVAVGAIALFALFAARAR